MDMLNDFYKEEYLNKFEPLKEKKKELERQVSIQVLDACWKRHLQNIDSLRGNIGLRAYAQRNPINEFKKELSEAYKFDKNDFRYWRPGGMELKLRNGAYGYDVEQAFKKAGYDVYGRDVDINRDSIKFNSYSKHWGTDDKKIRKVVLDVLGVDIERL